MRPVVAGRGGVGGVDAGCGQGQDKARQCAYVAAVIADTEFETGVKVKVNKVKVRVRVSGTKFEAGASRGQGARGRAS